MIETADKLVEVMVRARLAAARKRSSHVLTWDALDAEMKAEQISDMRAALLAAQREGAEMMPSEATEGMLDAFDGWAERFHACGVGGPLSPDGTYSALRDGNPLRLEDTTP